MLKLLIILIMLKRGFTSHVVNVQIIIITLINCHIQERIFLTIILFNNKTFFLTRC